MEKYFNHIIIGLISILIFLLTYTELAKKNEIVVWSEAKPLTWDNFTPSNWIYRNYSAIIKTSIRCEIKTKKKKARIFAFMNSKRSMYLDTIKLTKGMLKHEQYHFNISEYHARLLRKHFIGLGEKKITRKRVLELLEKYAERLNKMQHQYDSITKHGTALIKQPLWELKIDSLLERTKEYINNDLYSYPEFSRQKK